MASKFEIDTDKGGKFRFRLAMLISAVLLSAGMLTACGGSSNQQPSAPAATGGQSSITDMPSSSTLSPTTAQPAGSEIVISNFAYTVAASVHPGQQVTIVNRDDPNHTVTADANNVFDIRVSGGGGTETFTAPTTPGTYPFHCRYHANMQGTLTVQ
jgi:plastocyanin